MKSSAMVMPADRSSDQVRPSRFEKKKHDFPQSVGFNN
jgi:hypothetical protein